MNLTDRPALLRHRARAARAPALFLHDLIADEIQERLVEVNRTFTDIAVVTPFVQVWADRLPGARLIADDPVLDLTPGTQDLVIHALALHWADDPVGQIIQCRRALRPDGLFIGALFGGQSLQELRAVLAQAESDLRGTLSPRVLPMGDIRDLGALLQRSGLALPVADSLTQRVLYRDLRHMAADLRAMAEGNALSARHRAPLRRDVLALAQALYEQRFSEQGRLVATAEIVVLTGWAPDDSQQKPLRPGSAQVRLAQALGLPPDPGPAGGND